MSSKKHIRGCCLMSKQKFKSFRKHEYDDVEEDVDNPRYRVDKKQAKRVERALRTKDISELVEEEYDEDYQELQMYLGEEAEDELIRLINEGKL